MAGKLTLGGFDFNAAGREFAMPPHIREGGPEQISIHRQPGGARTIDILGRNDRPYEWSGTFLSANAEADIRALDAMRVAGAIYDLAFGTEARPVVISSLEWHYKRANWVEYRIECTQVFNADEAANDGGIPAPGNDVAAAGNAGGGP